MGLVQPLGENLAASGDEQGREIVRATGFALDNGAGLNVEDAAVQNVDLAVEDVFVGAAPG